MDQAKMIFLVTQQDPEQGPSAGRGAVSGRCSSRGPYRHEDAKGDCACHGRGNAAGTSHFHAGAKGYLAGEIELLEEETYDLDRNTELAMQRALQDLLKRYAQMNQKFGKEMLGGTAGA